MHMFHVTVYSSIVSIPIGDTCRKHQTSRGCPNSHSRPEKREIARKCAGTGSCRAEADGLRSIRNRLRGLMLLLLGLMHGFYALGRSSSCSRVRDSRCVRTQR